MLEEGEGLAEVLFSICWTPVCPQASPNCTDGPLACLCGYLSSWYARVTRQPCATHKSFSQWRSPKPSSFQGLVCEEQCEGHSTQALQMQSPLGCFPTSPLFWKTFSKTEIVHPRYFLLSKKKSIFFFQLSSFLMKNDIGTGPSRVSRVHWVDEICSYVHSQLSRPDSECQVLCRYLVSEDEVTDGKEDTI